MIYLARIVVIDETKILIQNIKVISPQHWVFTLLYTLKPIKCQDFDQLDINTKKYKESSHNRIAQSKKVTIELLSYPINMA